MFAKVISFTNIIFTLQKVLDSEIIYQVGTAKCSNADLRNCSHATQDTICSKSIIETLKQKEMFKTRSKDTRMTSSEVLLPLFQLWRSFVPCSDIYVVDLEHVFVTNQFFCKNVTLYVKSFFLGVSHNSAVILN